MKNYSIVRIGSEYVVRADDKCILKVSSRRQAVKLMADAAELLESQSAPPLQPDAELSNADDSELILVPEVLLDPEVTLDPLVISDLGIASASAEVS
jgi:hypothetical protein